MNQRGKKSIFVIFSTLFFKISGVSEKQRGIRQQSDETKWNFNQAIDVLSRSSGRSRQKIAPSNESPWIDCSRDSSEAWNGECWRSLPWKSRAQETTSGLYIKKRKKNLTRMKEILIRGGQAGTIGYSSQIAKLKQRVEEQDRQLDASKELYNELRKVSSILSNFSSIVISRNSMNWMRASLKLETYREETRFELQQLMAELMCPSKSSKKLLLSSLFSERKS